MSLTDEEHRAKERYPELGDPRGSSNRRHVHQFIGQMLESVEDDPTLDGEEVDEFVQLCLDGLAEVAQAAAQVIEDGRS